MAWNSDLGAGDPVPALTLARERRVRRRLFAGCFLAVALVGLVFTWARPALYRSEAVLSVVYEQGGTPVQEAFLSEQLVIHRQRLLGRQLLDQLAAESESGQEESLPERLEVRILDDARLLQLSATGHRPDELAPLLSRWIALYLQRFEDEQATAAREDERALQQQIAALDQKLDAKRQALEGFKAEHRIVSLERDENRALSQLKALGASLDAAGEAQAQAASRLSSIRRSIRAGEGLVRPQDQAGIDQLERRAVALEEQLREYGELYTQAYMKIDTKMQALERRLQLLRSRIDERRSQSRQRAEQDALRDLSAAQQKVGTLQAQYDELQTRVQTFSNHLDTFAALKRDQQQLQQEAQAVRGQLVELQVKRPYQSQVRLLEPPFVPQRPLAPDYWRDTGYSLAAALAAAVLAMWLFSLLSPRYRPEILIATAASSPAGLAADAAPRPLPDAAPLRLPEAEGLSARLCRQLIEYAEPGTALAIRLLLCGLRADELPALRWRAFDGSEVQAPGDGRRLSLSAGTLALTAALRPASDAPVWADGQGDPLGLEALEGLIQCAVLDAGLSAQQVDSRRLFQCYLSFLASQRLTEAGLEARVGRLPETVLDAYREQLPHGPLRNLAEVETTHPAAR